MEAVLNKRRSGLLWVCAAAGVAAASGCGQEKGEVLKAEVTQRSSAVTTPSTVTVSLTLPQEMAFGSLHLFGGTRLELTDRVTGGKSALTYDDGIVGNDSRLDALLAFDAVTVGHRSVIKKVGSRSRSGPGTIEDYHVMTQAPPLRTLTWDAILPPPGADVTVNPNTSRTIAAGRFRNVNVFAGATLKLGRGTYFVDQLAVEPGGKLELDSTGSTILYVLAGLNWKGQTVPASPSAFGVIYVGTADTVLERSLNAALLAPNAAVRLATPPVDRIQRGSFFTRQLLVSPDVKLEFIPANVLVPLTTTDPSICAGDLGSRTDPAGREIDLARFCSGFPDTCKAEFQARINLDRRATAARFVDKEFTAARYLGVTRDRTAKAAIARATADYACKVIGGDRDKDLVPDNKDRCANTPPLTPTDANGCPIGLPPAPNDDDVRIIVDKWNVSCPKDCRTAPPPSRPTPIGAPAGTDGFDLIFTHNWNEGGTCPSFYELEFERRSLVDHLPNGLPRTDYLRVMPDRDLMTQQPLNRVSFRFAADLGDRRSSHRQGDGVLAFTQRAGSAFIRFRVQTITPLGTRSDFGVWSEWTQMGFPHEQPQ